MAVWRVRLGTYRLWVVGCGSEAPSSCDDDRASEDGKRFQTPQKGSAMIAPKFERLRKALGDTPSYTIYGKVAQVVGLVVESNGPDGRIGDLCTITVAHRSDTKLPAEIV